MATRAQVDEWLGQVLENMQLVNELARRIYGPCPPSKNAHQLVSRNKREGRYMGRSNSTVIRKHFRSGKWHGPGYWLKNKGKDKPKHFGVVDGPRFHEKIGESGFKAMPWVKVGECKEGQRAGFTLSISAYPLQKG